MYAYTHDAVQGKGDTISLWQKLRKRGLNLNLFYFLIFHSWTLVFCLWMIMCHNIVHIDYLVFIFHEYCKIFIWFIHFIGWFSVNLRNFGTFGDLYKLCESISYIYRKVKICDKSHSKLSKFISTVVIVGISLKSG